MIPVTASPSPPPMSIPNSLFRVEIGGKSFLVEVMVKGLTPSVMQSLQSDPTARADLEIQVQKARSAAQKLFKDISATYTNSADLEATLATKTPTQFTLIRNGRITTPSNSFKVKSHTSKGDLRKSIDAITHIYTEHFTKTQAQKTIAKAFRSNRKLQPPTSAAESSGTSSVASNTSFHSARFSPRRYSDDETKRADTTHPSSVSSAEAGPATRDADLETGLNILLLNNVDDCLNHVVRMVRQRPTPEMLKSATQLIETSNDPKSALIKAKFQDVISTVAVDKGLSLREYIERLGSYHVHTVDLIADHLHQNRVDVAHQLKAKFIAENITLVTYTVNESFEIEQILHNNS